MGIDLAKEYQDYLARFEATLGTSEYGAFVKHNGRLVKKLRFSEFEALYTEYFEVASSYFESMDRGDTVNDVMVKQIRDRATRLLLPSPA